MDHSGGHSSWVVAMAVGVAAVRVASGSTGPQGLVVAAAHVVHVQRQVRVTAAAAAAVAVVVLWIGVSACQLMQ